MIESASTSGARSAPVRDVARATRCGGAVRSAVVTLFTLGIWAGAAFGQPPKIEVEVVPTDSEWQQFPPYCRARYSVTLYARGTRFEGSVPPDEMQRWRGQTGSFWEVLHHHCYGLIQLSRAPRVTDAGQRRYLYERAVDEFSFAYQNTEHPLRAQSAVQLGLAYKGLDEPDLALRYLDEALANNPKLESAYSAKGLILRQKGSLEEAKTTLLRGLDAVGGASAELNYFLGLTYFDLKDFTKAREYADKAYALGYPLPGLRNMLARQARETKAPPPR